jgi:rubrerythrin
MEGERFMLTEQEVINNALKEMLNMEELTAEKYADIAKQITKPELQNMLKGMEMAARNNYKSLAQKMNENGIS